MRGNGLSATSRAEITKPQVHIGTAHQFPTLLPYLASDDQRKDLSAGLGVVVFDGPQGHGFFKGGHDGQTANTVVCVEARQSCAVILSNDVRAEAGFAHLVKFILGDTGVPFDWSMAIVPGSRKWLVNDSEDDRRITTFNRSGAENEHRSMCLGSGRDVRCRVIGE